MAWAGAGRHGAVATDRDKASRTDHASTRPDPAALSLLSVDKVVDRRWRIAPSRGLARLATRCLFIRQVGASAAPILDARARGRATIKAWTPSPSTRPESAISPADCSMAGDGCVSCRRASWRPPRPRSDCSSACVMASTAYLLDNGARCVAPGSAWGSWPRRIFPVFPIISPTHVTTQKLRNSTRNIRPERRLRASMVGIVRTAPTGPMTSRMVLSFGIG